MVASEGRGGRAGALACAALFAASAAGVAQEPQPLDRRIAELAKDGDASDLVAALREAADAADAGVVRAVAAVARRGEFAVRCAAIEALGRNGHAGALQELHELYRRDTKLRDDERLFALLLTEIGRHGDPSSAKVLADHPFDHLTIASGRARIMGLARIRTDEALAELMKAAQKVGAPRRAHGGGAVEGQWDGKFRDYGRAALVILTGNDRGFSKENWLQWWRKEGRGFRVPEARPEVPDDVAALWESFWGEPFAPDRPARRSIVSPYESVTDPSQETVREAVTALDEAFAKGAAAEVRVEAIESWGGVVAEDVIRRVAKGLTDRDERVKLAAIEALGWMKSPEALKQLHREFRRNSKLHDQETLFVALLQGIGRHGDPSSVEVLATKPFDGLTYATGQARLLGLANIRDRRALEQLFDFLKLGGSTNTGNRKPPERRFAEDFRLALAALSGEDLGTSRDDWQAWWRENKSGFKVAPERPGLPAQLELRWQSYWSAR